MSTDKEAERIAAGLTEARKAMVLALPADGSFGRVPSRPVAKPSSGQARMVEYDTRFD